MSSVVCTSLPPVPLFLLLLFPSTPALTDYLANSRDPFSFPPLAAHHSAKRSNLDVQFSVEFFSSFLSIEVRMESIEIKEILETQRLSSLFPSNCLIDLKQKE